jgi:hypothetical protein
MFSSKDGTFIYDTQKGTTFRYFDNGSTIGFGKLNFHKKSVRTNSTEKSSKKDDLVPAKSQNKFSKNQLEQLRNLILKNKSNMLTGALK